MSKKNDKVIAYPELSVATRQDHKGVEAQRWTVKSGRAERGEAWTNFTDHTIQIPLVEDEVARVVRGHELVHSHISPSDSKALETWATTNAITPEVLISAEEFRVNAVLKNIGYDTDLLLDGSEKESGKRLAKDGSDQSRDTAFTHGAGLVGTKAFRHFINGVRSVNPEWAKDLREMEKELLKAVRRYDSRWLGDTRPCDVNDREGNQVGTIPYGFTNFIPKISEIIESYLNASSEFSEGSGSSGVAFSTGGQGKFAPLRIDTRPHPVIQVKGQLFRKKKASPTGKRIAYPSRLLTDPEKRIFSQKPKNSGGIVILDLSGSMSLSIRQVEAMVNASPGSLVLGYSHHKGKPRNPNAWILADRGKRVENLDHVGSGRGNGVDGPALEWAISRRRGSEPIIWVCDGLVTGGDDHYYPELAEVCAEIVKRHKITIVETPEEAVKFLNNPRGAKPKLPPTNRGVIALLRGVKDNGW